MTDVKGSREAAKYVNQPFIIVQYNRFGGGSVVVFGGNEKTNRPLQARQ